MRHFRLRWQTNCRCWRTHFLHFFLFVCFAKKQKESIQEAVIRRSLSSPEVQAPSEQIGLGFSPFLAYVFPQGNHQCQESAPPLLPHHYHWLWLLTGEKEFTSSSSDSLISFLSFKFHFFLLVLFIFTSSSPYYPMGSFPCSSELCQVCQTVAVTDTSVLLTRTRKLLSFAILDCLKTLFFYCNCLWRSWWWPSSSNVWITFFQ